MSDLGWVRERLERLEERTNNIENDVIRLDASFRSLKNYLLAIIIPIVMALIYALLR